MSKWVGVRVSAVLAILGSLLTLLLAGSMVLAASRAFRSEPPPDSPIPLKPLFWVMAAAFTAFAGWGIATAIGIFRRRGWARLSIIIFAVLLVGMGGSALIGVLFIRFPENPQLPPHAMQYARIGIAAVYGAMTVIGAWWLLLFNSSATKQYFAARDDEPGGRPLSITIIGWYLLLSALGTAVAAILRMPGMVGGVMLTGWTALVVYTLLTAVQIYLGTGLLSLQEGARIGAMVYFGLAMVNVAVTVLLPNFGARMETMMRAFVRGGQPPPMMEGTGGLMLAGTLVLAIPIWFLVSRRSAFRH